MGAWATCGADYHSAGAGEEIGGSVHGAGPSHIKACRGAGREAERLVVPADAVLLRGAKNAADRTVLETRPGKGPGMKEGGTQPGEQGPRPRLTLGPPRSYFSNLMCFFIF